MNDTYEKEVRFDLYCEKCKYWSTDEKNEPCSECLDQTLNDASEKPVNFKERGNK